MAQSDQNSDPVYLDVALDIPVRQLYTYRAPGACPEVGCRVRVPVGRRLLTGVVIAHRDQAPGKIRIRDIDQPLDPSPLFSPALIRLVDWSSRYYHQPLGEVWGAAMPAVLRRGLPSDHGLTERVYSLDKLPGDWPVLLRRAPVQKRVIELLNLQPDPLKRIWTFDQNRVIYGSDLNSEKDAPRAYLRMQPRSFYAVMDFLAYGVRVPPEEEEDGQAFPTTNYDEAVKSGLAVDLEDKFVVHWSKACPSTAFVAVRHRDKWFYIDDRNYVSKRFFNAVYDLFNLEVVPSASSSAPLLTLPVN